MLSAAFKFKPVFGKAYYLYMDGAGWSLSLISPDEWNEDAKRNSYIGECVLHADSTWSIEPSENLGKRGIVDEALARFYAGAPLRAPGLRSCRSTRRGCLIINGCLRLR